MNALLAQSVLIAGAWRAAKMSGTFHAENPATGEVSAEEYPVSCWEDCSDMLDAAVEAAVELRGVERSRLGAFLNCVADRIEARSEEIVAMAHQETGLAVAPRLSKGELPRTVNQLRQAATEASEGSWVRATIDTQAPVRSMYAPIGPVCVFGPNNFPLAFNGVAGGDFAAAIAAGNPVIAKAHPSHPGTTRMLAEEVHSAALESGLPAGTFQMMYHLSVEDGFRLVADKRLGATSFTGSRSAGLALKARADAAGKPIYLELSSLNPVIVLPGALEERASEIAQELANSCLAEVGQMCTSPKLIVLVAGERAEQFIREVEAIEASRPTMPMLSSGVLRSLDTNVKSLVAAGCDVIAGAKVVDGPGYRYANTLLRVSGEKFLANSAALQTEAFGTAATFVVASDVAQLLAILSSLEGNLTGCIYSSKSAVDDGAYREVEMRLRPLVGRLLNDKVPTGVAVSSAMNHGGPYPATGHPGFTSVGIPASLLRFAALQCYDNVREERLPAELRDKNPNSSMWRFIDREWTRADVGAA